MKLKHAYDVRQACLIEAWVTFYGKKQFWRAEIKSKPCLNGKDMSYLSICDYCIVLFLLILL